MATVDQEFTVSEWVIIVDSREQAPFSFRNITDGPQAKRVVVQRKIACLTTGDYSIEGFEDRIAVERKSLDDFWNCCGNDRKRFEEQLRRLSEMELGFVVVEADWSRIWHGFENLKLSPKSVYRSVIAWQQRHNIHWWFTPGRAFAEKTTYLILDRFYRDVKEGKRN